MKFESSVPAPAPSDFEALANKLPHLAWMAKPEGSIYWFNEQWYEYTGTTFCKVVGWGWHRVHHPDHLPQVLERWEAAVAAEASVEMIFPLRGEGATLAEVVDMALRPYRSEANDPFTISGPQVRLPTKTGLAFAMALHELITNAIKYGSLSTGAGLVSIRWAVSGSFSSQKLTMVWEESGGPAVPPPAQRGFGTRLIEKGLAADLGGAVRLDFPVTGVICTIASPLPKGFAYD